ncbi:hypothetical protein HL658_17395 [Azospirillum sp. RWY-5-1]|uniref:CPBP family intramembrane metalloprotease n=1 Tax=Azospirillum oleiclasticum TaxID=2735135 RepID=A0ABX2TJM6_9PROT|nr:hypothetical protein [Azospirillum oleiclasticum]NYZ14335.1 hypothetical protein [Azospirillum oleiclasticum]NYZ23313.1 hypothetical protein [Azospirillum oleiclasticum]
MTTTHRRIAAAVNARPAAIRWILAGPGAITAALLFTTAMPLWFPAGAAGVNHIAYPLVLAPLAWAAAFIHACLVENLVRGLAFSALVHGVCGALIVIALSGSLRW